VSDLITRPRAPAWEIVPLNEVTGLETPEEVYDLLIRRDRQTKEEQDNG